MKASPAAQAIADGQTKRAIVNSTAERTTPRAQLPNVDPDAVTASDLVRRARELQAKVYLVDLVDDQQRFVAAIYVVTDEATAQRMRKAGQ